MVHSLLALFALSLCLPAAGQDPAPAPNLDWPQFRGPEARGISADLPLPLEFEEPTWKTPIAGLSHASPVVMDGRVFVATAVAAGDEPELKVGLYGAGDSADDLVETEFRLIALSAETGDVLWDTLAIKAVPPFGRHTKATQANCTPAAADGAVVAFFGSHGLYCFEADSGKLRWHLELGPMDCGPWNSKDLEWGFAASPIIADGKVIVQADVKTKPFLAAFDLADGKQLWRVDRDDVNGWSTPTAVTLPSGERQIVVNGCKHIGGYSLEDGSERWRMAGGGGIPVPTPVEADGIIYLTSNHRPMVESHPQKPVFAVKSTASGDLGVPKKNAEGYYGEHLAWMVSKRGNYMQTPLIYGGLLWLCYDSGVITCFDAQTGEEHYRERLDGGGAGFTASPVAGGGLVYLVSEEGDVVVIGAMPEFEIVAKASLGEICMATPAITGGALIYRLRGSVARFD